MRNLVVNNRLIALAVALILWLYVNVLLSPTVQRTFTVKVRYNGLRERLQVKPGSAETQVTLGGLRRDFILANANVTNQSPIVIADVDLYNVRPGPDKLPIKIRQVSGGLSVVKVDPPELEIEVVRLERRELEVMPLVKGSAADGFLEDPPVLSTRTVVLEGPNELIQKVAMCQVEADISQRTSSFSEMRPVVVIGTNGQPVTGLTINPPKINVSVSLKKGWPTRQLPVRVARDGQLDPGYLLKSLTASPDTVLVEGPARVLGTLQHVETEPIDLGRVRKTATVTRLLRLPFDNLRTVDANSAKVTIQVEETPVDRSLGRLPILTSSTPTDLAVQVTPPVGDVVVRGLPSMLAQLASEDLHLIVDLGHHRPGIQVLSTRVASLPAGVTAISVEVATVSVTLAPREPAPPTGVSTDSGAGSGQMTATATPATTEPGSGTPGTVITGIGIGVGIPDSAIHPTATATIEHPGSRSGPPPTGTDIHPDVAPPPAAGSSEPRSQGEEDRPEDAPADEAAP